METCAGVTFCTAQSGLSLSDLNETFDVPVNWTDIAAQLCRTPPTECNECLCDVGRGAGGSPGGGAPGGSGPPAAEANGEGAFLRHHGGGVGHPGFPGSPDWNEELGAYWSHDYAERIELDPTTGNDSHVWLLTKTAAFVEFKNLVNGVYTEVNPSDDYRTLTRVMNGGMNDGWDLTELDGTVHYFGESGRWETTTDRNGNVTEAFYDDMSDTERITRVVFPDGRSEDFGYHATTNKLDSITYNPIAGASDPPIVFQYSWAGDVLATVSRPDGSVVEYRYDDLRFPGYLTHVIVRDSAETVERIVMGRSFDDFGNVYQTWRGDLVAVGANAVDVYTLDYDDPVLPTQTTVTDPQGQTTIYEISRDPAGSKMRVDDVSGACGVCGLPPSASFTYGDTANPLRPTSVVDIDMVETTYEYDSNGQRTMMTEAVGTSLERQTSWTYNATYPALVETITRESVDATTATTATTNAYDPSNGDLLTTTVTGYESTQPGGALAGLVTARTYHPSGSGTVATIDQPPAGGTDVTTFTYDPTRGNLFPLTRTDPAVGSANFVTNFVYDGFNRRIATIDPSGVRTETDYDDLNRVTETRTCNSTPANPCPVGGDTLTTVNAYNVLGDLTSTTLPKGNVIEYGYDVAGRLERIERKPDALTAGQRTIYEYDGASNRTVERLEEADETMRLETIYDFDNTCRLKTVTTGASTTEYDYDCKGNLVKTWDPNNPSNGQMAPASTEYEYDELDRLTDVIQPWGGTGGGNVTTTYGYDVQDHLVSVTDAEGNVTTYEFSDRDLLTVEDSPVSGLRTNTYDLHGNLVTEMLSDNPTTPTVTITSTRTYDDQDRLTSIDYGDPESNVTYAYDDDLVNGIGRVTSITRAATRVDYEYDSLGRLTRDGHLSYDYDQNGNREQVTYPGGTVVDLTFDESDRPETLAVTVPGGSLQSVVASAAYLPSGPLTGLVLANGLEETRGYDNRYYPDRIQLGPSATPGSVLDWDYATDDVGNMSDIIDAAGPNRSYDYQDHQYFLTIATGPWTGGLSWTYDGIGNRLTEQRGADIDTYLYTGNGTGNLPILEEVQLGASGGSRVYDFDGLGRLAMVDTNTSSNPIDFQSGLDSRLTAVDRELGDRLSLYYDGRSYLSEAVTGDLILADQFESGDNACWTGVVGGDLGIEPCEPPPFADDGWTVPTYSSEGVVHSLHRKEPGSTSSERVHYLHFGGRPVAQVTIDAISSSIEYVTTDHLGTPAALCDDTGAVQWIGGFEPFGEDWQAGQSGDATDAGMLLRLPGQWEEAAWDDATSSLGLFYNVHRWYEAGTGRYGRTDPLGLPRRPVRRPG